MHLVKSQEYQNQSLVSKLEALLILAKAGQIDGVMYVAKFAQDDHRAGAAGSYLYSRAEALMMTCRIKSYLTGEVFEQCFKNG